MPISMLTNGVTFFFMHWYLNKGIIYEPYENYVPPKEKLKKAMAEPKSLRQILITFIKKYAPTPSNMLKYSRYRVNQYGESHIILSVFLSLNYMAPYFMWTQNTHDLFHTVFFLRLIGALLCLGFLLKPLWPQKIKPLFPLYWHLALLYCLPFATTVMFALNGDSTMWMISVILFIMLLVVVVDWLSFLIIATLGVIFGFAFSHFVLGITSLPPMTDKYTFIYTCLFGTTIGLVFARRRAINTENRVKRAKNVGSSVGHEINHNNTPVLSKAQILAMKLTTFPFNVSSNSEGEKIYSLPESFLTSLNKDVSEIIAGVNRNKQTIATFKEIIEHDIMNVKLEVVSLSECIKKSIEVFPFENKSQRQELSLEAGDDLIVKIPPFLFQHIITNLLRNAHRHGGTNKVSISINKANRTLHFKDWGHGIPPDRLHRIFDPFFTTSSAGSGVGLAFSKALVEGFNGSIECQSKQGNNSFTEFTISFPPLSEEEEKNLISLKNHLNKGGEFWG